MTNTDPPTRNDFTVKPPAPRTLKMKTSEGYNMLTLTAPSANDTYDAVLDIGHSRANLNKDKLTSLRDALTVLLDD